LIINKIKYNCYKGYCNFNKLRIHANPDIYILKFTIENNYKEVILKFSDIEINVSDCNDKEIRKYDSHTNIMYCEEPICLNSCPVDVDHAICLPASNNTSINDPEKNICQCAKGFKGTYCDIMDYVDYRY